MNSVNIGSGNCFYLEALPEPMLIYCQLYPKEQLSVTFKQKIAICIEEIAFENVVC